MVNQRVPSSTQDVVNLGVLGRTSGKPKAHPTPNADGVVLASLWGFGIMCANRGGSMLKSVEGVYRDGKIELTEFPGEVRDETRVIVTFLETSHIDLRARGIDEAQAAELRAQLGTFAEEWNSPDMALYDNYDAAKAKL
jgi:hypothetical protein